VDAAEPTDLETFVASAQRVVDYLNARPPLTDWSVSRVDGHEQVHLHVRGGALLDVGDRVPWEETFCRRMLAGASNVVPDSRLDPDYADLPAADGVRAYAGVPIVEGDGSLFGTLCGVRAEPLRTGEPIDQGLLDVFAELLSAQLALVRTSATLHQSALLAEALASSDRLTGLMNRRGWDLLVSDAQERIDALGDLVGVVMIDLDDLTSVNDRLGHQAGDARFTAAGRALSSAALDDHRIARYGGDEFSVYVEGEAVADLAGVARHYAGALAAAGVSASVGSARVIPGGKPGTCLERALAEADAEMYATKLRRRGDAAS
jgi:diguanylate cyclase (GGDEF)-like protein